MSVEKERQELARIVSEAPKPGFDAWTGEMETYSALALADAILEAGFHRS